MKDDELPVPWWSSWIGAPLLAAGIYLGLRDGFRQEYYWLSLIGAMIMGYALFGVYMSDDYRLKHKEKQISRREKVLELQRREKALRIRQERDGA